MEEHIERAQDELKRVDHLVYVSLKYTRTVDVLLNTVNRMIDAYEAMFKALLQKKVDEQKIPEIPETPVQRANKVSELYQGNDEVQDNVDLFLLLRKLNKAEDVEKEEEYRRHVTMRTTIEGREEVLNIDIVSKYYDFQKEFFREVKDITGFE